MKYIDWKRVFDIWLPLCIIKVLLFRA